MPPDTLCAGAAARWELRVTNRSALPLTVTFPSTQGGDVSLGRDGVEHYRWSEGRVFAQMIEERQLGPGEAWACVLEGSLDVQPGRYEATGTMACRPAPPAARASVVVAAADGD